MRRFRRRKSAALILLSAAFIAGGLVALWAASLKLPDLRSFEERRVEQSTKIYDRTGTVLLYDLHENVRRTVVPFSEISRHAKNATVAIEDAEFYEHRGIRPLAILRATLVNIGALGFSQGGSTITQQVVKNAVLTKDKTPSRKLKEWVLALKLERALPKEEILALYLNETPYGGSMYGIEEASQSFFGKSARDLTLAEAAYLAALPQAPTYYSPYGNHRDKLEERKNLVLEKMLAKNFITPAEYEEARGAVVSFLPQRSAGTIRAPHFVFFIREYLEERYGKRALDERGLRVITTLDAELEARAERIVEEYARQNEKNFNASNAALVAIDPKTGQILAMVGSRDYFDTEIDGNFNVAVAPNRQPGSAFKPFVYATALAKGYTPETVVFDLKTQFSTECAPDDFSSEPPCYSPGNYDNVFHGPVTFRNALAQSINVPAVKVLYLAGLAESLKTARDMGITSLTDVNRYGLTLVLGGGEVSLLEMTSAYGVFANDGVRNPPTGILRIEEADGTLVEEFAPRPHQAIPREVARQVTDILADNDARSPAFGEQSSLYFPGRDVAAKTGTTNDYRDAWIIGYTPTLAVGAWAGNNDYTPMEKRVAGFIVAPLWHAFMEEALTLLPEERFAKPEPIPREGLKPILKGLWQGGETYVVDTISGKLATEHTPPEYREERVVPNVHAILFWVDRKDPRGEPPARPEGDPQFSRWEYAVSLWKKAQGIVDGDRSGVPTAYDDVHRPEYAPVVAFVSPKNNAVVGRGERIPVSLSLASRFPIARVEYAVNGVPIAVVRRAPYSLLLSPADLENPRDINELSAVAYDAVGNRGEAAIFFTVL